MNLQYLPKTWIEGTLLMANGRDLYNVFSRFGNLTYWIERNILHCIGTNKELGSEEEACKIPPYDPRQERMSSLAYSKLELSSHQLARPHQCESTGPALVRKSSLLRLLRPDLPCSHDAV